MFISILSVFRQNWIVDSSAVAMLVGGVEFAGRVKEE
jgi:hypothetical protein